MGDVPPQIQTEAKEQPGFQVLKRVCFPLLPTHLLTLFLPVAVAFSRDALRTNGIPSLGAKRTQERLCPNPGNGDAGEIVFTALCYHNDFLQCSPVQKFKISIHYIFSKGENT